ncbi:hypothetical protein HXA31_00790 [Salipaludibacillus agaradhaerens]|jgi:hypothetical protein|uniref:Uncharacterized protein n=1 Tax=Salipaludibacillus agaradhaerens TaxID=76935 RepID=A0A9Q4B437_SALAG|nr:hypothetical protein [Salipaludibacillus agaradhaerens]MCR6097615.1 hypothetical protein [Salipaludibacillus agaradhaerens]MCR6112901.1 hypothetical protein [Salipaludibacillus agaradhaerens]
MNKGRLHQFIGEELSIWWVMIGIILYLYGFFLRLEIFDESYIRALTINQWDIVFSLLNDIYLHIFIIQIALLFMSIKIIHKNTSDFIIFRAGNYKKWMLITLKEFIFKTIILICLLFIVNLLLIIGVPKSLGWSVFALGEGVNDHATAILSVYVTPPIWALILHLILLGINYSLCHLLLSLIYLIFKNIFYSIGLAVFIWLLSVISFNWFNGNFAFLTMANFFSLSYGTNSYDNIYSPVIVILIYFVFTLGIYLFVDINFKRVFFKLEMKRKRSYHD